MVNIDGIICPMYASAGVPSVKLGILLANGGTPIYNNFENAIDSDSVLLNSIADALDVSISSLNLHRNGIDALYTFTIDFKHGISQNGSIEIVFPTGYDISLSACYTNIPPVSQISPV